MEKISQKNNDLENFLYNQKKQKEQYQLSDSDIADIKLGLPDKKYYEFAYYMYYQNKHLNLETEYNKWQSWDEWDYPVYDLFRFNLIVLQNKKHFSNKNILDLGSNLGYFSLFSLYSGCKNVKGIDVRSSKLEISKFICKKAGYTNFSFEEKNINDFPLLDTTLKDIDTILCLGLIYHVSNHYQLLTQLTNSKASCIIIDNSEQPEYVKSGYPHIHWKFDDLTGEDGKMRGYMKDKDKVLVGKPNQAWIDVAMTELGWNKQKVEYYKTINSTGPRVCSVFTR